MKIKYFILIFAIWAVFAICGVMYIGATEDVTEPIDETPIEETVDEYEQSEVSIWFDEEVMPFIITALGGLSGTGIISAILAFFLSKAKKASQKQIEEASKALNLTADEAHQMVESTNKKMEEFKEFIENYVKSSIDKAVEELGITTEQILASQEKQQAIANSIADALAKLDGGNDEDEE